MAGYCPSVAPAQFNGQPTKPQLKRIEPGILSGIVVFERGFLLVQPTEVSIGPSLLAARRLRSRQRRRHRVINDDGVE